MERDDPNLLMSLRVESKKQSPVIINERWEFNAPKFIDLKMDEGYVDEKWFDSEETKNLKTPVERYGTYNAQNTHSILQNSADKLRILEELEQPLSSHAMEMWKFYYERRRSRQRSRRKLEKKQAKCIISCCRMQ